MILSKGLVYKNGKFEENTEVFIEHGLFSDGGYGDVIDCDGCYIVPGLIDIHTHGAMGFDAGDGTEEALRGIAAEKLRTGTTVFLATVATDSKERTVRAAQAAQKLMEEGTGGADIGGVYLEGPYFSGKRAGAQNREYLRDPSGEEFCEILESGAVKVISLAPELPGAEAFARRWGGKVKLAAGHTDALYSEMEKAYGWGFSLVTHTFNGMRGFTHREPGMAGFALDSDMFCEYICDGIHVAPGAIRVLYKAKGADKMVMISDSVRPAGLGEGESISCGQPVFVKDGVARLGDGTIAGSISNLLEEIRLAVRFGIPLEDAVLTATLNPAKAAGIDDRYGSIEAGKKAHALVLSKDLQLLHIVINGRLVF